MRTPITVVLDTGRRHRRGKWDHRPVHLRAHIPWCVHISSFAARIARSFPVARTACAALLQTRTSAYPTTAPASSPWQTAAPTQTPHRCVRVPFPCLSLLPLPSSSPFFLSLLPLTSFPFLLALPLPSPSPVSPCLPALPSRPHSSPRSLPPPPCVHPADRTRTRSRSSSSRPCPRPGATRATSSLGKSCAAWTSSAASSPTRQTTSSTSPPSTSSSRAAGPYDPAFVRTSAVYCLPSTVFHHLALRLVLPSSRFQGVPSTVSHLSCPISRLQSDCTPHAAHDPAYALYYTAPAHVSLLVYDSCPRFHPSIHDMLPVPPSLLIPSDP